MGTNISVQSKNFHILNKFFFTYMLKMYTDFRFHAGCQKWIHLWHLSKSQSLHNNPHRNIPVSFSLINYICMIRAFLRFSFQYWYQAWNFLFVCSWIIIVCSIQVILLFFRISIAKMIGNQGSYFLLKMAEILKNQCTKFFIKFI